MVAIESNLKQIETRIAGACERYERSRANITLVGISKTQPAALVQKAWQAGLIHFGENKIQEAETKIAEVGPGPIWHLVGHLQTNKAKKAIRLFSSIESVDSLKLAETISKECVKEGVEIAVLLEVNSSGESSKYGFQPDEISAVAEKINKLDSITLNGLMTIGPLTENIDSIERAFEMTEKLFMAMQDKFGERIKILSMGMSEDFETAIKFGSTELRIGTAIFGGRDYHKYKNSHFNEEAQ